MKVIYWMMTRLAWLLCWLGNGLHKLVPNK